MKILFKSTLFTLSSVLLGFVLLALVYAIPSTQLENHLRHSSKTIETEGVFPVISPYFTSQLDNWTDSTMLLTAAYSGPESLVEKTLINYHYRLPASNPAKSLISISNSISVDIFSNPYARYWHGYLMFLKPLLYFFDYNVIRILNSLSQLLLTLYVIYILKKNNLSHYILPWLFLYGLLMPLSLGRSLQFSTVFYILSISSLLMIIQNCYKKYPDHVYYHFLFTGIATSFFDFLTYPIATFGIPVTLYFCIHYFPSNIKRIQRFVSLGFFWGFGYAGMWAGKWILATLFTDSNIILDALQTLLIRSSSQNTDGIQISLLHVFKQNIVAFLKNPVILIVMVYLFIQLYHRWKHKQIKQTLEASIIYLFIASLPLIWYACTQNHSCLHYWFTYKALIVSAFAVICLLCNPPPNAPKTIFSSKPLSTKENSKYGYS